MHPALLLPLALLPFSLAAKQTVKVGDAKGSLIFDPNTITAAKGDTIEFSFYPQSHSVAQSSFDKPCQALNNGIFSGFIPSSSGAAKQIFTVTVNGTDPIWLYCSQQSHCQNGMAMVINEPKDKTLKTYQDNSKKAESNSPSEVAGGVVSEQTTGSSSSSASAASSMSSASSTGTASAASATSATSASAATASASSKPNAVGKLSAGAGMGALGLLGVMVGGMV